MNIDSIPHDYRRACVDVYVFDSVEEMVAQNRRRKYAPHDVAYVRSPSVMAVADRTGVFDTDCLLRQFTFDMHSLPDHIPLAQWHAEVIRLGKAVEYRVDHSNATVQRLLDGQPQFIDLLRHACAIKLTYQDARLRRLFVQWLPNRSGDWLSRWCEQDIVLDLVCTRELALLMQLRPCDVVRDALVEACEQWRRATTPLAAIYLWTRTPRDQYRDCGPPLSIPHQGVQSLPPGWQQKDAYRLAELADELVYLHTLTGPAATRAAALDVCRLYATKRMHGYEIVRRVCAYLPPVDVFLDIHGLLISARSLTHAVLCDELGIADLHAHEHVARLEATLNDPAANLRRFFTRCAESAWVREPHNQRVYVERCMILFDMCPSLSSSMATTILELTDDLFTLYLSRKRRVQTVERVYASCERVLAARKLGDKEAEPTSHAHAQTRSQ